MAFEYPDVMNDVLDAGERFESGSVQYLAEVPEGPIAAGEVVQVALILQSVMDVPVKVSVHFVLPELSRKLRRMPQPLFEIFQPDIQLTLSDAEAAELIIPIRVHSHVPAGQYPFRIQVGSEPTQEGMRIRLDHGERRVGDIKIRHPQGMRIAQISSWGYASKQSQQQTCPLVVGQPGEPPDEIDLKPKFNSLWVPEDWALVPRARVELNDRRIHTMPHLTAEALYLPFMKESQVFFGDCGVRLHVGEAIFLSKMLTYTVTYLTSQTEWQDCLLVPIYAYAQAREQSSDDALWLVTVFGYAHVVELAVALSFALVEDALGRELWAPAEQRVVREFVSGCLEQGTTLPSEFLYLPLLLGGIIVGDQIVSEGEDVTESLRLLSQAKAERGDLFAEEDLRNLNDAFDRLVARQARGRARSS
jgi:hypothetical protein